MIYFRILTLRIVIIISFHVILFQGKVNSFKSFPLRIDFNAPISSKDREWFNLSLAESEENIQLECDVKSENEGFQSKLNLYTDNLLVREVIQKQTISGIKIVNMDMVDPLVQIVGSILLILL